MPVEELLHFTFPLLVIGQIKFCQVEQSFGETLTAMGHNIIMNLS